MCLGSFIISSFLDPHIMPTSYTKVRHIARTRCVTNYTTTETCRNKITYISWNIIFFLNKYFLSIMMSMLHFVHFLFYGLVTFFDKDSVSRTWFIKFRISKSIFVIGIYLLTNNTFQSNLSFFISFKNSF